jgi:hypothetical protein
MWDYHPANQRTRPSVKRNRLFKAFRKGKIVLTTQVIRAQILAICMLGLQASTGLILAQQKSGADNLPVAPAGREVSPGFVSGVVLAKDTGLPIPHVLVRVAAPSIDMRTIGRPRSHDFRTYDGRSDDMGRFRIQAPRTEKISLDAFAPGYQSAAGTYMSGGDWTLHNAVFLSTNVEFTINLVPALYVAGVVVDEAGHPFRNATIEATMQESNGYGYVAKTETDADGHFEIFDFPTLPGDARGQLLVEDKAMLRSRIDDVYKLGETERARLRIVLRRGHDVKGLLTSATGRPVPKTLVDAVPSDDREQHKETLTDAEGRFQIGGLPDGPLTIRAHSLVIKQKVNAMAELAGADAEVNLRLEPIVLATPPKPVALFGMEVTDLTPELRKAYDLGDAKGVLILDPGANSERLGIGALAEGDYFWTIGEKSIGSLKEMVSEMLRNIEIEARTRSKAGSHGSIRVVYSSRHWSHTQYLDVTDKELIELKKISSKLGPSANDE